MDLYWLHIMFCSWWWEAFEYGFYICYIWEAVSRVGDLDLCGIGFFLFYLVVILFIGDLIISFGFVLVVISFLMFLVLCDLRFVILVMVLNLLSIVMVLVLMGFIGIFIDLNMLLIVSIVIGILVDDIIHLLYYFCVHWEAMGDVERVLCVVLDDAGRAMIITLLVLVVGFFVYVFGALVNIVYFGILVGVIVVFVVIFDLILCSVLLCFYW